MHENHQIVSIKINNEDLIVEVNTKEDFLQLDIRISSGNCSNYHQPKLQENLTRKTYIDQIIKITSVYTLAMTSRSG